jgi:hypothetical protein
MNYHFQQGEEKKKDTHICLHLDHSHNEEWSSSQNRMGEIVQRLQVRAFPSKQTNTITPSYLHCDLNVW